MTYEDYNVLTYRSLFANNVNVDVAYLYSHEKIHIRCEQRSGAPRNEETSQFVPLPRKDICTLKPGCINKNLRGNINEKINKYFARESVLF